MGSTAAEKKEQEVEPDTAAGASQGTDDNKNGKIENGEQNLPTGQPPAGNSEEDGATDAPKKVTFDLSGSLESEYLKKLEERLRLLEQKLQVSAPADSSHETEITNEKSTNKGVEAVDDESSRESEEDKEDDEDEDSDLDSDVDDDDYRRLKLEHNFQSYTEWRRMKQNESKRDRYNMATIGNYVLDIVRDKGDVGFTSYPAHDENDKEKKQHVLGRVRINSEAVIDSLNEVTGSNNLPTPCIMLHPFKLLVEKEKEIRTHYQSLYNKDLEEQLKWEQEQAEKKEKEAAAQAPTESIAYGEVPPEGPENDKAGVVTPTSSNKSKGNETKGELAALSDGERRRRRRQERRRCRAQEREDGPRKSRREKRKRKNKDRKPEKRPKNYKLLHFERLIDFLDNYLKPEVEVAKEIREGSKTRIHFAHLWHLFQPGELIYAQDPRGLQSAQIYHVVKTSGGRPRLQALASRTDSERYWERDTDEKYKGKKSMFVIDCYHIDFDGKKFRPIHKTFSIANFPQDQPIDSLDVFPLRFVPEPERSSIRTELLRRGETFMGLTRNKSSHREYVGMTIDEDVKEEIDSRIIVDFGHQTVIERKGTEVLNPVDPDRSFRRVFGLGILSKTDNRELMEQIGRYASDHDQSIFDDTLYDQDKTDMLYSKVPILKAPGQALRPEQIGEQEKILLPGHVYGYVLRMRDFRKLDVMLIRDVNLNKHGFEDLVLPKRHRKLIKALVDRHSRGPQAVDEEKQQEESTQLNKTETKSEEKQVDIVRGKGKGLIILLHGVPGVGKTSTAETIADATDRPLLPVTCGDIGETAAEVEESLERIFGLAHRWGCVLLMDEADGTFLIRPATITVQS
jgi:ATPase family associated with various cellular activities (AAA)